MLFHGLEGSSSSHYAQAFAAEAKRRGWRFAVPHFRGCSGEINLAPRAYHSGDHEEVGWMLERFRALHAGPIVAVGVSLGGNALLRFVEEAGASAAERVRAVAAVSAPLDLAAGGRAIGRGFGRQVYTRMFMRTMKRKALVKLGQHPGLFDAEAMRAARDLRDFDEIFTGPLHGFTGADDYYARSSAKAHLDRIRIPALVLNARNDPFLPASALPAAWRGRAVRDALAAGARRPRRLCRRALARAPQDPSGQCRRLARPSPLAPSARRIRAWTPSSPPPSRSGPTCRTATPGSPSMRAATGTCATTASRRPARSRASRAAASITRSCASSSPATTRPTTAARGSSRTARSASTSSSRRRRGSGASQPDPTSSVVVTSHTGLPALPRETFVDEAGRLFLASDLGLGIVHTLDMTVASDLVERGVWQPQDARFEALVERFAYRLSPAADRPTPGD